MLTHFAWAQDPYYSTIDIGKGLPSNSVYCIFQDSKGFMWFATNDGICRYDGFEFKSYYNPEQTSKAGSLIKEDKYGRIWYENFDGRLYYIENEQLHCLKSEPEGYYDYGIIDDYLISVEKGGVIATELKTFKKKRILSVSIKSFSGSFQTKELYYLFEDSALTINSKLEIRNISPGLSYTKYREILPGLATHFDKKTFYYNRSRVDDTCFVTEENKIVGAFKPKSEKFVQNLCHAGKKLWFCCSSGVLCYEPDGKLVSPEQGWFRNININCVFQSDDGCYWIGTAGKGILLVRDPQSKTYLAGVPLTRIEKKENKLLIGTKNDEIIEFDPISNNAKTLIKNKDNHPVDLIKYDSLNKTLYYTSMQFHIINEKEHSSENFFMATKDLEVLNSNYAAVAASGLIGLRKTRTHEAVDIYDSLYKNSYDDKKHKNFAHVITAIRGKSIARFKNDQAFYCASNLGFFKVDPFGTKEIRNKGVVAYFSKIDSQNEELMIALGTNGFLWTMDNKNNFKLIDSSGTIRNIFLNDSILCVYNGSRIDFHKVKNTELTNTDLSYPLSSDQVHDIKIINNKLYITTDVGLLTGSLNIINVKENQSRFYINSIRIRDSVFGELNGNRLGTDENDMEISYSLIDYKCPEQHKLEYSINNLGWKELPVTNRSLTLASLSGGDYVIRFRLDGLILANTHLAFSISTPWWKQWWFYMTCFIFLSAIIIIYSRWQTRILKKRNLLLIQKIELEKNLNQSMLTSIKAQMNPHFFYNALNTIQSYIFTDDKLNAANYLSKFSKLTRIILEMSGKESIPLTEEINALTLYLELEKVRFSNDLNFSIKAGGLETDMIRIPSMIIQPFVENAIKHGLLHKKGEKQLNIEFNLKNSELFVTIDDNGVGRKKAGELNRIKEGKHESFSTSANSKRLEILNEGKENKVGISIIDKHDDNGQASGTTVIVKIPI
ncbi:MAG TPA: histidine kinase [Bacteroidia bacterium]